MNNDTIEMPGPHPLVESEKPDLVLYLLSCGYGKFYVVAKDPSTAIWKLWEFLDSEREYNSPYQRKVTFIETIAEEWIYNRPTLIV